MKTGKLELSIAAFNNFKRQIQVRIQIKCYYKWNCIVKKLAHSHSNWKVLGLQESIGILDVKTKNVHFYVQRNSSFVKANSVIPFELARLNKGSAMNLVSGIFTAPASGIYHFEFSGVKLASSGMLDIYLQLNGVNLGHACTVEPAMKSDAATSLSASLRLKAGDRVNLYNNFHSILPSDTIIIFTLMCYCLRALMNKKLQKHINELFKLAF